MTPMDPETTGKTQLTSRCTRVYGRNDVTRNLKLIQKASFFRSSDSLSKCIIRNQRKVTTTTPMCLIEQRRNSAGLRRKRIFYHYLARSALIVLSLGHLILEGSGFRATKLAC